MRRLAKCSFLLPEDMTCSDLVGMLIEQGLKFEAESPQELVFSVPREIAPKVLEKSVCVREPIGKKLDELFPKPKE